MNADTLKLLFSYIVAIVVIAGGGVMLFAMRLDPPESGSATLSLAIVGFIGAAITWVFSSESATRATRAARAVQEETAVSMQAAHNGAPAFEQPLGAYTFTRDTTE